MSEPLRILIADDHDLFRNGVAAVLSQHSDLQIVAQAANGLEAVDRARQTMPDLILMDLTMPKMSGLEAIQMIKSEMPHVKTMALTVSDDDDDIFTAMQFGAHAYLLKDTKEQQLISAIRCVMTGEAYFSGKIATRILEKFQQSSKPEAAIIAEVDKLTDREQKVLELIVNGHSNKEIAATLQITSGTVKNHVTNILYKLHLRNRIEVAVFALLHGMVEE